MFDGTVSLMVTLLAVGVGILFSLRAGTVQEAQQSMAAALMLPPTIAGPIVLLIARSRPGLLPEVVGNVASGHPLLLLGSFLGALAGLSLVLAAARFRRGRLVCGES